MTDAGSEEPASASSVVTGEPGDRIEPRPPDRPPRSRTTRFAGAAVVVILVGVIVLVVYALTGPTGSPGVVHRARTSGAMISALAKVPTSVFDSVGVTASSTPLVAPTVLTRQPPLDPRGKPEVLFVGTEFCPFCGAERWPLIVALSRFGHFTTLYNMQSAQLSVFPGVPTFTFVGTSYASRYVAFTGVELYSDAMDSHGAYTRIATLSPGQSALLNRYGKGTGSGKAASSGTYPFVDVDNKMVTSTSGFSPAVIDEQSQSAIAGELSQPDDPTGQAIVASANYLTAGICQATDQQPASVCASRGVRSAVQSLGLG
jgi:hypothetical protein